jgi:hypothetical protein
MEKWVLKKLHSPVYLENFLALAASKYNHDETVWNRVYEFLDHQNLSLRIRAIDSLCEGGGYTQHEKLFTWAEQHLENTLLIQKIFDSLHPQLEHDYQSIHKKLENWILERKGALQQPEILQQASTLYAQLHAGIEKKKIESFYSKDIPLDQKNKLDQALLKGIPVYFQLSTGIQSILRSAELMWQYPELYDESIDKSTALIQFTKAIDIFLQGKLGQKLFFHQKRVFFEKMQSRIFELELHDTRLDRRTLLNILQCQDVFTIENFPFHKLHLIVQSIEMGTLLRDPYRVIDGLRAWAILLLIFARDLTHCGRKIPSIIAFYHHPKQDLKFLATGLNDLQELRNKAAHHGVISCFTDLDQHRQKTFSYLNVLVQILG